MIRVFLCLLPLALSACASTSNYPSLARRPAERITGTADVVTLAPAPSIRYPAASANLTTRLAQLVDQARTAHQRFAERRGNAERLIAAASGSAVASESWSVASIALADLETARSDTMIALASLDEIYTAEAVQATDNGADVNAAMTAHSQVEALVAEEDVVLSALRGRLRS
jgi:hypothetical protein